MLTTPVKVCKLAIVPAQFNTVVRTLRHLARSIVPVKFSDHSATRLKILRPAQKAGNDPKRSWRFQSGMIVFSEKRFDQRPCILAFWIRAHRIALAMIFASIECQVDGIRNVRNRLLMICPELIGNADGPK